jgi:hypothetical protein
VNRLHRIRCWEGTGFEPSVPPTHLASGRRFKSSRGGHFVSLRLGPLCDNVEIPSHASEVWSWPISALIRCTIPYSEPPAIR